MKHSKNKEEYNMAALHVTVQDFEKEVLQSDKPVLVDFWADWCGPCKMLLPIIEGLADEVTDTKICKVNVDEQGELAQRYKVMTIPTLILFKNGEIVTKSVGLVSKNEILELLKK
ncbi:MAG: thioredoxin [Lachnospiraceae bacterium]|nr:thioredoxin [Lachnospiraceae bacterium]